MLLRCLVAIVLLHAIPVQAESVVCPATRDLPISSHSSETAVSRGKAPRIKLKGYQEFGLFDFDVSVLQGRRITAATLHLKTDGGGKHGGEARGTDLRWFTVSTISSEWEEGVGNSYGPDLEGSGASFNEAKGNTRPWSHAGSKVYDVTMGNGNSLRCDVDAGDPKEGWMVIPIDVRLIEALISKSSHGLLVMDGNVFITANCYVASRESKTPPFLTVTVAGKDDTPPSPPTEIHIDPAPNEANDTTGAATVTLMAPKDTVSYDVRLNGKRLHRWQIPAVAQPQTRHSFPLDSLPPLGEIDLEVIAVDGAGNASSPARCKGNASDAIHVPALPLSDWTPVGAEPPTLGGQVAIWAVPEICKLDPVSGAVVLEKGMDAAPQRNRVWDAATRTIRISSARGEIAGFQIALKTQTADPQQIQVKVDGLTGIATKLWRTWFVKAKGLWQADYAIPVRPGEQLSIPDPQNQVPDQRVAVMAIDLIVPAELPPGDHRGTVTATLAGGESIELPLTVSVHSAVIPPDMHFIPEMNCYRGPLGAAGSEAFNDAFKLAHYHRSSINRVPHSHSGNTDEDWTPTVDADGRVIDWTTFDKNLGPLLDGSLFKNNPRAGVPVPALYLPFNESWPLPIKPNYNPGNDVPLIGEDWRAKHDILAKPPEQAFDQHYQTAFTQCVRDFVQHFEDKKWTRTLAEGFNNNKASYGSVQQRGPDGRSIRVKGMSGTAWTLDEPATLLDWQALRFYSRLFHNGLAAAKTSRFVYRGDISRPQWQGNYMDGLMEVMVSNGSLFNMMPLMKAHRRRMPAMVMAYGACNTQDRSNHETTAWVLKAYTHECDGVLPWQSIGSDNAFEHGDFTGPNDAASNGNALIVDGSKRFGVNAIASFRVHAFRCGAQIAELLRLLELKNGWGRAHSLALVSQIIPLSGAYRQAFVDEAAPLQFPPVNGDDFVKLKEGILTLLDGD